MEIKQYVSFKTFLEMTEFIKRNKINPENIIGHGWSYEHKHFFQVHEVV